MGKKMLFVIFVSLIFWTFSIPGQRTPSSNRKSQINKADIATLLSQERSDLRSEMVGMQSAQYQIMLGLLGASGALIGLIFGKDIFAKKELHTAVVFFLAQLIFILSVFNFTLMRNMGVHAEYIQAIENKINSLAGETITIWESVISPRYLFSPKSSGFWLGLMIGFIGLAIFVFLIFYLKKKIGERPKRNKAIALLAGEIFVLLALFAFMQIESGSAYNCAMSKFSENNCLEYMKIP